MERQQIGVLLLIGFLSLPHFLHTIVGKILCYNFLSIQFLSRLISVVGAHRHFDQYNYMVSLSLLETFHAFLSFPCRVPA